MATRCKLCDGKGQIFIGNGKYETCSMCNGTTKIRCNVCNGKGEY